MTALGIRTQVSVTGVSEAVLKFPDLPTIRMELRPTKEGLQVRLYPYEGWENPWAREYLHTWQSPRVRGWAKTLAPSVKKSLPLPFHKTPTPEARSSYAHPYISTGPTPEPEDPEWVEAHLLTGPLYGAELHPRGYLRRAANKTLCILASTPKQAPSRWRYRLPAEAQGQGHRGRDPSIKEVMARTLLGPPPNNLAYVRFLDGDKKNWVRSNLAWSLKPGSGIIRLSSSRRERYSLTNDQMEEIICSWADSTESFAAFVSKMVEEVGCCRSTVKSVVEGVGARNIPYCPALDLLRKEALAERAAKGALEDNLTRRMRVRLTEG
jgi:hypothetical protein